MNKLSTNEIRKIWIEFWQEREHLLSESKSLIPYDDDSLLFVNSGVATLKKYLSGEEIPPAKRIVNSQKSLRTNDIENVGVTARHHTMFEMLGNFSIGDYFKEDAIKWAWEILTEDEYYGFPKDKLYITVHPDDDVTIGLWESLGVAADHIVATGENFWEIGKGPGGPNTEIFFDRGEKYDRREIRELLAGDLENDRVVEIWNIVFSQYNCDPGIPRSEYPELPQKNIDTGMGLERMACVIQGVETNFETDNFKAIMDEISKISGTEYAGNKRAYRVIADHIRALTFAISDGVNPSNEGRGYVIRRILRRAEKYGYIDLNTGNNPFLYRLVGSVVDAMKEAYPDLLENQEMIEQVIKREEESFLATLKEGLRQFESITETMTSSKLSGDLAFKLYDTYGFPLELTLELAEEKGIEIDIDEFNKNLEAQKKRAREARKDVSGINAQNEFFKNIKVESVFTGYEETSGNATIKFLTDGEKELTELLAGSQGFIILDKTPFYATSGGQEYDMGSNDYIEVFNVTKLPGGQHLHHVNVLQDINRGDEFFISIDEQRREKITRNHSATHLLHYALTKVFGEQSRQAGSNQDDKRTRFDYTAFESPTVEELREVQEIVRNEIKSDYPVTTVETSLAHAKEMGAKALFGEKYGNVVRVVSMGPSVELCGGTHVKKTGDVIDFMITSAESVGSGTRRIEAITGRGVKKHQKELIEGFRELLVTGKDALERGELVNIDEIKRDYDQRFAYATDEETLSLLAAEIGILEEQNNDLKKKQEQELRAKKYNLADELLGDVKVLEDGTPYINETVEGISTKELKGLVDDVLVSLDSGIVILKLIEDKKVTVVVKVSSDLQEKYPANKLIQEELAPYDGRGGGKADMAQGGGTIK